MDRQFKTRTQTLDSTDNLELSFVTEQFKGEPELDTKVEIEGGTLCWISLPDKDKFVQELEAVISKYRI